MGWWLFAKLLPEAMLTYCRMDTWEINFNEFNWNVQISFLFSNWFEIFFCNILAFSQGTMCYNSVYIVDIMVLTLHVLTFSEENMYLHFMSFLHTDMPKIIELLPRIRPGLAYFT